MSINITDGYRLRRGVDIFDFCDNLRSALIEHQEIAIAKMFVDKATIKFDMSTDGTSFKDYLMAEIRTSQQNAEERSYLFSCFGTLYKNPTRDEVYLLLRNTARGSEEKILVLDEVEEEYSYWNNSDSQLSYLSQEQWDDRLLAWKETQVFDSFRNRGLTVNIVNLSAHLLFNIGTVEKYWDSIPLPVYESRFKNVLYHAYTFGRIEELGLSDFYEAIKAYSRYASTEYKDLATILPGAAEHPDWVEDAIEHTHDIISQKEIVL
jgi:hypothetical protein